MSAEEHVVFVRVADGDEWQELSRHAERDDAMRAMREALVSEQVAWAKARLDPGGELFVLTPQRAVIEIMHD